MNRWSLVGREVERRAIDAAFAAPDVGGVVLVGDSGVGLTRLAREALVRLATAGCRPEWVPASVALAAVPFGAVAHLLPPDQPPDGHPLAVAGALADRFGTAAVEGRRRSNVVAVDDAHLLDASSAAVLAQLATRGLAFVLFTVHRGRPTPEPVSALWKDGVARRVAVPPLAAEAIDALVSEALGGPVDGVTAHRLRQATAGRPAVLRELVACGRHGGALRERYGVWRWRGRMTGSWRIVEQIAARLAACPPDVRAVLEVAACGEPMPLHSLEQLAGGPGGAIEEAERSGLLVVERSDSRTRVRLANPLHADAIRDGMPLTQARRIWSRLAEVTAATPMRRRDDALRVAVWQLEAGVVTVPHVLVPAARQAMTSDPEIAEWCARAARDADVPGAHLVLAEILEYGGRAAEAVEVLATAPRAHDTGALAATRATVLYWGLGERVLADEALHLGEAEPGRDLAEALRTWLLLFDGSCEAALDTARVVLSRPSSSDQAIVWAVAGGSGAAGLLGRLDEAARLRRLGLSVAQARAGELPWAVAQVECAACAGLYFGGHVERATAIAEDGYRAAAAEQVPLMLGIWAMLRGVLATAGGRVTAAQSWLREAVVLLEETDTRLVEFCLTELAATAALTGDAARSAAWLARAGEHASAANRVFAPWRERARAWVLVGRGSVAEAVTVLQSAASTAGSPTAEAYLRYDAARLGAAAQVHGRLRELAGAVEGPFVPALATCAAGLAASPAAGAEPEPSTTAGLARAAGTLARLGHTLLAVEAMRAAARAYRRLGQRSRARVCAEQATAWAAGFDRVRTPLLSLGGVDATLTAREREVVLLAVDHPSKEIAARLGLATSTVNNHLASAYAKLGISGRAELADLVRG
jgi:DNA-binding CsgD family transcriptional regulator